MAYLQKSDYTLRIPVDHLDQILTEAVLTSGLTNDQCLANAEKWAAAMIRAYLVSQYNIDTELARNFNDSQRNMLIVQTYIDLVLCTVHKTINPRNIPEHIAKGCEEAKTFLESVRDRTLQLDLPAIPASDTNQVFYTPHLESQEKFISKPYQDLSIFDREQNP